MGMLTRFKRFGTAALYTRIGGRGALEVIVEDFYCRVLDDEQLAGFYAGANMRCVKARQVEFLSALLGGPGPYAGESMRQVHEGRGSTMHHCHGGRTFGGFAACGRPAADCAGRQCETPPFASKSYTVGVARRT